MKVTKSTKKTEKTAVAGKKLVESYKAFLDAGKTERECVVQIIAMAEAHGYKDSVSFLYIVNWFCLQNY